MTVLTVAVVRNGPGKGWSPSRSMAVWEIGSQLRTVWGRPGTRLGFFGHMGSQFSMMTFALLWGVPYLESAQHLPASAVGVLMTLFVLGTIALGPVIGLLTARYPMRRSGLLLGIVGADALIWTAVLAFPSECSAPPLRCYNKSCNPYKIVRFRTRYSFRGAFQWRPSKPPYDHARACIMARLLLSLSSISARRKTPAGCAPR